jgi:ankyrin repeat protein
VKVVKLLLANDGVDPDSKDTDGRTPLLWAAENGYEAVVQVLWGSSQHRILLFYPAFRYAIYSF